MMVRGLISGDGGWQHVCLSVMGGCPAYVDEIFLFLATCDGGVASPMSIFHYFAYSAIKC